MIYPASKATTSRTVRLESGCVIKKQEPHFALKEYLRTQRAHEISRESGVFIVPEIVSFDRDNGNIVFERLNGFENLLISLSVERDPKTLIKRVGHVLAYIHKNKSTEELGSQEASILKSSGVCHDMVFVHGDFSWQNILYNRSEDVFAVIDWSFAQWLSEFEDAESVYTDIGIMLMSLFSQHYFSKLRPNNPSGLARVFLKSYMSESSHNVDAGQLKEFLFHIMRLYWPVRKKQIGALRALIYYPTIIELKRFAKGPQRKEY